MYRILIVEDEKEIRLELKLMLENALYEAEAAEDFSAIPRLVEEAAPDLILLDIQLPGTDGLKVCRDIDDNTLSVNITRIRGKMKEIGLENMIVTRRGQGYQL